jgi:hypothetical protein
MDFCSPAFGSGLLCSPIILPLSSRSTYSIILPPIKGWERVVSIIDLLPSTTKNGHIPLIKLK